MLGIGGGSGGAPWRGVVGTRALVWEVWGAMLVFVWGELKICGSRSDFGAPPAQWSVCAKRLPGLGRLATCWAGPDLRR